jgi:serine/threonine protein kinase
MMSPSSSGGKRRFTDYEASQIIGGLLSAVEHVHSKNYVHRDLKPENVLIGNPRDRTSNTDDNSSYFNIEGRSPVKLEDMSELRRSIKLADFGLSTSFRIG